MARSERVEELLLKFQKNEITENKIYARLAATARNEQNRKAFQRLAAEEMDHYEFFKNLTSKEVRPSRLKVRLYSILIRLLGLNFGVRLMEKGEDAAQASYKEVEEAEPRIRRLIEDEEDHEQELMELLDQEALQYTGSIVLGLNDALVELIGALAGLTLALQNTRLVAIAGMITGIAASFSMAGSEYLSTKEEGGDNPLVSSLYTGVAYIFSVVCLIAPYFIFEHPLVCFGVALAAALLIILLFTFYVAIAKELPFKRRFFEMAGISLGVAILNFGIGLLVRRYLGIDIE